MSFYHNGSFTREELKILGKGDVLSSYGKRYGVCNKCRTVVRLNKILLGSMHVCLSDEDIKKQDCHHVWEYYEGTKTNRKNCVKCDIDVEEPLGNK